MTTAHDFPDISLSSIGSDGSSGHRLNGRLEMSFEDRFNSTSVVPDSNSPGAAPCSKDTRTSASLFDDSLDFNHSIPCPKRRPSPVAEEGDDELEESASMREESRDLFNEQENLRPMGTQGTLYPKLRRSENFEALSVNSLHTMQVTRCEEDENAERCECRHDQSSDKQKCPCWVEQVDWSRRSGCLSHERDNRCAAYADMERRFARSLQMTGIADGYLPGSYDDSPRSSCLVGVRVLVEMKCCDEGANLVRRKLREMGATIVRDPGASPTHVVWSSGGDRAALKQAIAATERPYLVAPQWVHSCFEAGARKSEDDYSLYDERYVSLLERRISAATSGKQTDYGNSRPASRMHDFSSDDTSSIAVVEPSGEIGDMTFDNPMTATQLLQKIEILSKRLDKVAESKGHGNRCASRLGEEKRSSRLPYKPLDLRPKRRRSHGGFTLRQREPNTDAAAIREENRDVLECLPTIVPAAAFSMFGAQFPSQFSPMAAPPVTKVRGVDDMRRTVQTDLRKIRQTLKNNVFYTRATGAMGKGRGASQRTQGARSQTASQTVPSTSRRGRPSIAVVQTRSAMINDLQYIPSADEFAKRHGDRARKRAAVLSGFSKSGEKQMLALADTVQLKIVKEVDESIRCLISIDGGRSLNTLKAVVQGVPVVRPDWLKQCKRVNRVVSVSQFEYDDWRELLRKRATAAQLVFARVGGKIKVLDGCTPSAADLKFLIRKSGGWLTSNVTEAAWIVAPNGFYAVRRPHNDQRVVVSETFIIDCITANKIPGRDEEEEEEEEDEVMIEDTSMRMHEAGDTSRLTEITVSSTSERRFLMSEDED